MKNIVAPNVTKTYTAQSNITAGQPVQLNPYYQSDGGIAYDSAISYTQASGTTWTQSFTVGTHSNKALVIFIMNKNVPSGVTYGGAAMTNIDGAGSSSWHGSSWYLMAPANGANNIVVSGLDSSSALMNVHSYYNVAQTSTPSTHSYLTSNLNGYPVWSDLTMANACSLAVGAAFFNDNNGYSFNHPDNPLFDMVAGINNISSTLHPDSSNYIWIYSSDSGVIQPTQTVSCKYKAQTSAGIGGALSILLAPYTAPVARVAPATSVASNPNLKQCTPAFIGFASANINAGASGGVIIKGQITGLSLTAGSIYYVQDSAGTIGTTPGTRQIKAGIAISTTILDIANDNKTSGVFVELGGGNIYFPHNLGRTPTRFSLEVIANNTRWSRGVWDSNGNNSISVPSGDPVATPGYLSQINSNPSLYVSTADDYGITLVPSAAFETSGAIWAFLWSAQ